VSKARYQIVRVVSSRELTQPDRRLAAMARLNMSARVFFNFFLVLLSGLKIYHQGISPV